MNTYWLSFKIAEGTFGGRDKLKRTEIFWNMIENLGGTNSWRGIESFVVFEHSASFNPTAAMLEHSMAPALDMFLLQNMQGEAVLCGGSATDYQKVIEPDGEWKYRALVVDKRVRLVKVAAIQESQ